MRGLSTRIRIGRLNVERKLRRKALLLASAFVGVIGAATGCSSLSGFHNEVQYNRSWDDFVSGYRNSAWSAKAWHCRKHQFCNERYLHDFCRGFRAGYQAVADGDNGCTPAFPPREYWSWRYQSAEGQSKVAAWYSGYPHGARAAEEDGIGNWTQIQTSSNIQSEYAQFGKTPSAQVGMYPIAATTGQPVSQPILQNSTATDKTLLNSPASPSDGVQTNLSDSKGLLEGFKNTKTSE